MYCATSQVGSAACEAAVQQFVKDYTADVDPDASFTGLGVFLEGMEYQIVALLVIESSAAAVQALMCSSIMQEMLADARRPKPVLVYASARS